MPEFDSSVRYIPVVGFPAYMVGSDGSVWTCLRRVFLGRGKGSRCIPSETWTKMAGVDVGNGRLRIRLYPNPRFIFVHRLILEAFVGPRPPGMVCRHFPDRNPANNAIDNIQWGTEAENQQDRVYHGTDCRGEKSQRAKLTEKDVHHVRLLSKTMSLTDIAKKFGVSLHPIWAIVRGKTWKHLKPEPQTTE